MRTSHGTAKARVYDPRGELFFSVRPSIKLRRAHDLPAHLWASDLEAQVATGEICGKTSYGTHTMSVGKAWRLFAPRGSELDPVKTANTLADAWAAHDRRRQCPHPHPTDPYCRDCGAAADQRDGPDE